MTKSLIDGFHKFYANYYEGNDALMPQLATNGQQPEYFIISCSDSRSDPATIFSAPPGRIFGFKAIGAIIRDYEEGTALSAALTYAIDYLHIKKVIVLGHTNCGAIGALVNGIFDPEIASFVNVAKEGHERAKQKLAISVFFGNAADPCILAETEKQTALLSAEHVRTYPAVARALGRNDLSISTWIFDMHKGDLLQFNEDSQQFETVIEHPAWAAHAIDATIQAHDHHTHDNP
jgi:carbonic anhydrase